MVFRQCPDDTVNSNSSLYRLNEGSLRLTPQCYIVLIAINTPILKFTFDTSTIMDR